MARLRRIKDDLELELGPRSLLGRSSAEDIKLTDASSSGEHASIYHAGELWFIKALSSLNGTLLNDRLLPSGTATMLSLNSRLCFGGSNEVWVVSDLTPPREVSIADTLLVTATLDEIKLQFEIESLPGEQLTHPLVVLNRAGSVNTVAPRAYHSLLLLLAFLRSPHFENSKQNQGWINSGALVPIPYPDIETLNVNIFRARKQFEGIGIKDGNSLIERQSGSRLIRLGTENFSLSDEAIKYCKQKMSEISW